MSADDSDEWIDGFANDKESGFIYKFIWKTRRWINVYRPNSGTLQEGGAGESPHCNQTHNVLYD